MSATDFRVHFGEALQALDAEDVVVEKGGMPVALLIPFRRDADLTGEGGDEMNKAYSAAVSRPAKPNGLASMIAAMERGWAGIAAAEMVESILARREAAAKSEHYALDEEADDSEVPAGQRYLYSRTVGEVRRVADESDSGYTA